jgi:hypothetical protein
MPRPINLLDLSHGGACRYARLGMADEMAKVFAEAARRQVFPSRWQRPAHLVGRLAARPWWSLDLLPVRAMGAAHQLTAPAHPPRPAQSTGAGGDNGIDGTD